MSKKSIELTIKVPIKESCKEEKSYTPEEILESLEVVEHGYNDGLEVLRMGEDNTRNFVIDDFNAEILEKKLVD